MGTRKRDDEPGRLAPHDGAPPLRNVDPLQGAVGWAVCRALYSSGTCACERQRRSLCSSIEAAAGAAIKIVRAAATFS